MKGVKRFTWDPKKNTRNKLLRGVSFEDAFDAIQRKAAWVEDNTSKLHPGQSVFVFRSSRKTWIVPFEETETELRLITIFEKPQKQRGTR
jgi:uncharacterized DUF497 family protein